MSTGTGRLAGKVAIITGASKGTGAVMGKQFADAGGAGEGELAHHGVAAQLVAHRARLMGGDDVDDPGGNARLLGQGRQRQRAQGRLGGGLDDYGATGGQCRAGLAGDHGDGEVPGRDGRAHPNGLAQHQQTFGRVGAGDGFAIDTARLLGKPLHEAGTVEHFAPGLGGHHGVRGDRAAVGIGPARPQPGEHHRVVTVGRAQEIRLLALAALVHPFVPAGHRHQAALAVPPGVAEGRLFRQRLGAGVDGGIGDLRVARPVRQQPSQLIRQLESFQDVSEYCRVIQ